MRGGAAVHGENLDDDIIRRSGIKTTALLPAALSASAWLLVHGM